MNETKKITVEVDVEVPADLEFERRAEWRVPESLEPWADANGTIWRGPTIDRCPRLILTPKPTYADQVREWWPEEVTGFACVATYKDGEAYFFVGDAYISDGGWMSKNYCLEVAALINALELPPFPKCDDWRESKVANPYKQEPK